MKRWYLIGMVVVAAMTGCSGNKSGAHEDGTLTVDVAHPVTDSLTITVQYPATLKADKTIDVVARVDGYVVAKHYTDGQQVHRGQLLFSIEDTQYRDAVAQAEASLATAKSQVEYAERRQEAMQRALQSNAVSQMDVVQANENLNQAKAAMASAQASLETARTNLGYCSVRALSDGRITDATVDVGDYVAGSMGAVTLATIYDDSVVKAEFAIDDARYMAITRAAESGNVDLQKVSVTFADDDVSPVTGRLSYVAPDVSRTTGTIDATIHIDNRDGALRSGMYATVHLPVVTDSHAVLINDSAISTDQQGKYVYVVNDSDRVVYTPVTVGDLYRDTLRMVVTGIDTTQVYVTKALLKVHDGMHVKPVVTNR